MSERRSILICLGVAPLLAFIAAPDATINLVTSAVQGVSGTAQALPLPPVIPHKSKADDGQKVYFSEPVTTVHLPAGEKFVQFVPANDENWNDWLRRHNQFLTEIRLPGEKPRRLTFYGPDYNPDSWKVVLYIQEH